MNDGPGPPSPVAPPTGWRLWPQTLEREVGVTGRGLHTGRRVRVRLLPVGDGEAGRGIVFRRVRRGKVVGEVAADARLCYEQPLCTMLRAPDGTGVRSTEHILAALTAAEIDSAVIELDREELPCLDGGAAAWLELLDRGGRRRLPGARRFLRVMEKVRVADAKGNRWIEATPAGAYEVWVANRAPGFDLSTWSATLTPEVVARDLAPTRSFGPLKWAVPALVGGWLTGRPILRGARFSSTAAIVGRRVVGGLRGDDEFARHRALDLVGDLALLGAPLLARVRARRPTHALNHQFAAALLSHPAAWGWAAFPL